MDFILSLCIYYIMIIIACESLKFHVYIHQIIFCKLKFVKGGCSKQVYVFSCIKKVNYIYFHIFYFNLCKLLLSENQTDYFLLLWFSVFITYEYIPNFIKKHKIFYIHIITTYNQIHIPFGKKVSCRSYHMY